MTSNHRIITGGDDWMRDIERRVGRQERRANAPDLNALLGPGIGTRARQVADWNDPTMLLNGWYYAEPFSINSPDPDYMWIGSCSVMHATSGVQQVWSHGPPITEGWTREFSWTPGASQPTFGPWRQFAPAESGVGAHTHLWADITDKPSTFPPSFHTHVKAQITDFAHSHLLADLPVAADGVSSSTSLVRADDTRLSNARAPLSHGHPITDLPVASSGTSSSTLLVRADDARLSNSRTPTSHTHVKTDVTDFAHTHPIADLPVATSGTSSSTQVVRADDSRLSNSRTPTSHTHPLNDLTSGVLAPPLVMTMQATTPSTPSAGNKALYFKTDGAAYTLSPSGLEIPLVPRPDQLHINASLDAASLSTSGPSGTTVTARLVPDGWSWFFGNASPPTSVASDDTYTLYGLGRSVKVNVPVGTAQSVQSSIWAVTAGALVTCSAWVRGNAPRAFLSIATSDAASDPTFFGGSGVTISDSVLVTPSSAWQKITHSVVVPAGHTKARFMMRCDAPTTAGDIWWDETESSLATQPAAQVITGTIQMWPAVSAPAGYLLCNGGTFDSATYPILATLLGDTYGTHSGTTYYLPDFRGRSPIGAGTASPAVGGNVYSVGQKVGHERMQQHTHGVAGGYVAPTNPGGFVSTPVASGASYGFNYIVSAVTVQTGAGNAENLQPSLGINYIIKT